MLFIDLATFNYAQLPAFFSGLLRRFDPQQPLEHNLAHGLAADERAAFLRMFPTLVKLGLFLDGDYFTAVQDARPFVR